MSSISSAFERPGGLLLLLAVTLQPLTTGIFHISLAGLRIVELTFLALLLILPSVVVVHHANIRCYQLQLRIGEHPIDVVHHAADGYAEELQRPRVDARLLGYFPSLAERSARRERSASSFVICFFVVLNAVSNIVSFKYATAASRAVFF